MTQVGTGEKWVYPLNTVQLGGAFLPFGHRRRCGPNAMRTTTERGHHQEGSFAKVVKKDFNGPKLRSFAGAAETRPRRRRSDGEGSYVPSRIASFYASLRAPKACT